MIKRYCILITFALLGLTNCNEKDCELSIDSNPLRFTIKDQATNKVLVHRSRFRIRSSGYTSDYSKSSSGAVALTVYEEIKEAVDTIFARPFYLSGFAADYRDVDTLLVQYKFRVSSEECPQIDYEVFRLYYNGTLYADEYNRELVTFLK